MRDSFSKKVFDAGDENVGDMGDAQCSFYTAYAKRFADEGLVKEQISSNILASMSSSAFEAELDHLITIFIDELSRASKFEEKRISQNKALSENCFLMTVCAELRIPLFIVGKPGTSKSLARSIVAE